jgi:NAD(P)-dependent dehydrogenase (short-subunit alcohol dehydrogenase family)
MTARSDALLAGRNAVVTGACRGIGAAIAAVLVDHGAHVVVCGRRTDEVDERVKTLTSSGGLAVGYAGDLSEAVHREGLLELAGPIDILVNNAGGFLRPVTTRDSTPAEWRDQLELNLTLPFLLCQLALPGMVERRWGRIVNIGSVTASAPQVGNAIGYVAAKAGLVGFTRQLAVEVAEYGVTANVVNPGTTATEHLAEYFASTDEVTEADLARRIPVGRLGRPEEVAGVIPFLVSEVGGFTTGAVIDVTGGAIHA